MGRTRRRTISAETRRQIWMKTKGRCWYCGVVVSPDSPRHFTRQHIDHLTPFSEGGSDELDNLVLACLSCNLDKGARTVGQYRLKIGAEWASPFRDARYTVRALRRILEAPLAWGADAALKDLADFCTRAGFLFYGEQLAWQDSHDYQI